MLNVIQQHDTFAWSRSFLNALARAYAKEYASGGPPSAELRQRLSQLARRTSRDDPPARSDGGRPANLPGGAE